MSSETAAREALIARLKSLDLDEIREQNELHMREAFITPDRIYLDLALLKDLRLGAAMHLRMAELEQCFTPQEFRQALVVYKGRDYYDVPHYFPTLKVTNADIDAVLHDPTQSDAIFAASIPTEFCNIFHTHILLNANHSTAAGHYRIDPKTQRKELIPIRVFVNTYPLTLSKRATYTLGAYVAKRYGVDAEVGRVDPHHYPLQDFLGWEEHYLYYLKEYIERQDVAAAYLEGRMLQSRIFGLRYCGYTYNPTMSTQDLNLDMVLTKAQLDILSTFNFLEPWMVSPVLDGPTLHTKESSSSVQLAE